MSDTYSPDIRPTHSYRPVYLLIDTSESMGDKLADDPHTRVIDAVTQGLKELFEYIERDDDQRALLLFRIISFNHEISVTSLTNVSQIRIPDLTPRGLTYLGDALRELDQFAQFGVDLIRNSPQRRGTRTPLAFIFTDGAPSPECNWEEIADTLHQRLDRGELSIYGIACGKHANREALLRISPDLLVVENLCANGLKKVFQNVTLHITRSDVRPRKPDTRVMSADAHRPPPPTSPGVVKEGIHSSKDDHSQSMPFQFPELDPM
jgi:uncharacterized protein YegL